MIINQNINTLYKKVHTTSIIKAENEPDRGRKERRMKIVFEMADVDYENKDFLLQALDFEKAFFFNDIMENCVPLPKVLNDNGYISIDDVMSVFDDFMRGDADENDTERFLEMLKDKAESEDKK